MAKKKSTISESDANLFRDTMKDVKPLRNDRITPQTQPIKVNIPVTDSHNHTNQKYVVSDYVDWVDADETLEFCHGGLQHKTLNKLRRGEIAMQSRLDLHGKTAEQAGQALSNFIANSYTRGIRYVLIIHGRGKSTFAQQPVIKSHVNQWLRSDARVVAFVSASPKDGGAGALYVVLKRNRDL